MKNINYPALYNSADSASSRAQKTFLSITLTEYSLLFLSAILTLNQNTSSSYNIAGALIFFLLLGLLIFRSYSVFDRSWYRSRAVAESVKTLTWRYMMHASPFSQADEKEAEYEFRKLLGEILKSNTGFRRVMAATSAHGNEITEVMRSVRRLPLAERADYYDVHRVGDQHNWYRRESRRNAQKSRTFVFLLCATYLVAAISALTKIAYPEFAYYPTEPMIALAGGFLGWMQIKKFNELSAAYGLTAHEIGLIPSSKFHLASAADFSEHVNDAEMAFSREHTQWIARQAG